MTLESKQLADYKISFLVYNFNSWKLVQASALNKTYLAGQ